MFSSTPAEMATRPETTRAVGFESKLLRLDGLFLLAMGSAVVAMDLWSYGAGAGPFAATFLRDPLVIGVVEAHGLAALVGVMTMAKAKRGDGAIHLLLAATHLLLGTANIAFFAVFDALGGAPQGIIVTSIHFAFAIANTVALIRLNRR